MKTITKTMLSLAGIGAVAHVSLKAVGKHFFEKTFVSDRAFLEKDIVDFLPDDFTKERYLNEVEDHIKWFQASNKHKKSLKSYDGLHLDGILVQNHVEHRYMILVHGFNTDRYILLKQAYEFDKRGFNVLLIDQRGYGASQGDYTTFGFKEHLDLTQWIDLLVKEDNEAKIGLYGVSMGAATVMMALGTKLSDHVVFAIEDSGFTNAKDEFAVMLKMEGIDFTTLPIYYLGNEVKERLGFSLDDISPESALKENVVPICFVHGKEDSVVPYEMAKILYNANKGEKAFYPVETGAHAYACYQDHYFDDLMQFISKYI